MAEVKEYILGIDPGVSGAMAIIDPEASDAQKIIAVVDLPTQLSKGGDSKAKEIDAAALSTFLDLYKDKIRFAVLEKVSAMTYIDSTGQKRGQGAAASFAFGKGYGVVLGTLTNIGIPVHEVVPAVWKISVGLSYVKSDSIRKAKELFVGAGEFLKLKKHDGRAEALLLAHFGIRFWSRA